MLGLFYVVMGFHWWAAYSLGIHSSTASMIYNILIFASILVVIGFMLAIGGQVNKKKLTHEFYQEKISEEKQRLADQMAKDAQKAAKEAATYNWVLRNAFRLMVFIGLNNQCIL